MIYSFGVTDRFTSSGFVQVGSSGKKLSQTIAPALSWMQLLRSVAPSWSSSQRVLSNESLRTISKALFWLIPLMS